MPHHVCIVRAECSLCGWHAVDTSLAVVLSSVKRCGCIPRAGDIPWDTMKCRQCGHIGGHDEKDGCVHAACPKCETPITITNVHVTIGIPR